MNSFGAERFRTNSQSWSVKGARCDITHFQDILSKIYMKTYLNKSQPHLAHQATTLQNDPRCVLKSAILRSVYLKCINKIPISRIENMYPILFSLPYHATHSWAFVYSRTLPNHPTRHVFQIFHRISFWVAMTLQRKVVVIVLFHAPPVQPCLSTACLSFELAHVGLRRAKVPSRTVLV